MNAVIAPNVRRRIRNRALIFKDIYGDPFILTPGQIDIFNIVHNPKIKRGVIRATTQYGKSEVTSLAIIMAAIERVERILIVAPSDAQASIIMGKVIEHFFDHTYFTSMIDHQGKLELLKQERSKKRITLKNGSEIKMITAQASTVAREAKSLMGFGATMVVVDESCLIPDTLFSKILRMIGGVEGGKLVQLSNPFEKNHFHRAFLQDRYVKLVIDYKQALKEKRITKEFLDEAREEMPAMDFQIFYECNFPDSGAEDALIPEDWIELSINQPGLEGDSRQAGVDVARFGNDKSVYIYREGGQVKAMRLLSKMDTMAVVGWVAKHADNDEPDDIAVDAIGIGAGVLDRLDEMGYPVHEINAGAGATDSAMKEKFANLRAQMYWNLRSLFKPGKNGISSISIPNDKELIEELRQIRYKYSSERKIKIEPKDDMKKRLGRSPDKSDALALAFFSLTDTEPQLMIV